MALRLIIGGSGSGKSCRLYREVIRQSMENPGRDYLILVPEQFTMQTQKELVAMHPAGGIMNIDVLSFQRLAYHVFDEVGGNQRTVLEETGKSLVIRRLAQQKRKELVLLGSKLERMGYVGEMKSVLSELSQYQVGREQLEAAAAQAEGNRVLQDKLHDIVVLQEAFREYKKDTYITAEEILEELCTVVGRSRRIADSVVALDGFTGFTPVQYLLLKRLMECARDVLVTVTMDIREYPFTALREEELFAMSKQTIWELRRIARESQVPEEEPPLLDGVRRAQRGLQRGQSPLSQKGDTPEESGQRGLSPLKEKGDTPDLHIQREDAGKERFWRYGDRRDMAFLERHLLRYDAAQYDWEKGEKNIRLFRATDPEQEVLCAARRIRFLVQREGYRYREIAVITGDMEGYRHYVERQFADSHIPCFIDYKRDILSNPFVEFLRSVLQMMEENFSYDSVFRYLRSGLSGIGADEVDRMDNYCVAMGIRGYKNYVNQWERLYQGQSPEELEAVNRTREAFVRQVKDFRELYTGKGKTVRERTEGLYRWCERLNIQQRLKDYELSFQRENKLSLAKEYAQVYRLVIELFDKLVELMGEEKIPLKEYRQILDAGFEEAKVGIIPPSTDQVMVGDIERTRLKDIRALFFLGVNDGIIPSAKDSAGILSQLDRESLKHLKLHLAPDRRENSYIQQFYLYLNLTKPSERLYVSYCSRNRKGEVLRPSYLVGHLLSLYPGMKAEQDGQDAARTDAVSARQGLVKLAGRIGQGEVEEADVRASGRYYMEKREWRERLLKLLSAAGERRSHLALDRAVAKAVYGDELTGSATRLEKYAACAYAHFLSYGLRLRERQEYTFAALDLGNILHKALEEYTEELEKGPYTWFDIPEESQRQLMDLCVEQAVTDYGNTVLLSSSRNSYMIERMKQMGRRTVWALTAQVRKGSFVPRGFEISFSAADHLEAVSFSLEDGTRMKLTGRIDRTDICEDEEHIYVKVIDYKTGARSFDAAQVYYGLSLQLVVYLNAAMEMEKRTHSSKTVVPAAMLYYQVRDPVLEADGEISRALLEDMRLKELCTKGLVNSSPDIIRLLDAGIGASSQVIPAGVTKAGTLTARSSAASTEQLERLSEHVKDRLHTFGEEIMGGNISLMPYRKGEQTACDYCPYQGICGFDPKLPGHQYRKFAPMSLGQVLEELGKEEE